MQFLRSVAVIMVLFHHYFYIFYKFSPLVSSLIFLQVPEPLPSNIIVGVSEPLFNLGIDFGGLGVSIFFLISGFVIPLSIEKLKSKAFLISRFFRIYPPYFVGLFITIIVLKIITGIEGITLPYSITDFFMNLSLFRDGFNDIKSIDAVNWTLEIEVKFYLFILFVYKFKILENAKKYIVLIVITSIGLIFSNSILIDVFNSNLSIFYFLRAFIWNLFFFTFMSLGTLLYFYYTKRISKWNLILSCLIVFSLFIVNSALHPYQNLRSHFILNYTIAFAVFSLCYIFSKKIKYSRVLDYIANISYPLYFIHAVNGYVLLTYLISYGINIYLSVIITIATAIGIASILHFTIERKSIEWGKKLIGKTKINRSLITHINKYY